MPRLCQRVEESSQRPSPVYLSPLALSSHFKLHKRLRFPETRELRREFPKKAASSSWVLRPRRSRARSSWRNCRLRAYARRWWRSCGVAVIVAVPWVLESAHTDFRGS